MDPDFVFKYYGGETLFEWLATLWSGPGSGGAFSMTLKGPDNGHAADKLLEAAEKVGYITKGNWSPIREHRFFGLGGMSCKSERPGSHPREFMWSLTAKGHEFVRERRGI